MRPPEWSGTCPLCRAHTSVFNLRDAGGSLLAEPETTTLFGCVFVQGGTLGLASYHFDAPEDCYISYANAPRSWRLDDGSAPPSKKEWAECSFDAGTLTFRGVVHWDPPFGGMNRWDYEMIFSEDFVGIIGGQVKMHFTVGDPKIQRFQAPWESDFNRALAYLRWTPPPSTIFGSVYVQGLAYAPFLEGIASYHFDAEDVCYISYSNAPPDWLLDDGSPPPAKKPFCDPTFDADTRTFRGRIVWDPPFNGEARWEYEIVFAEDFGSIVAGQMHGYGPDGSPRPSTTFSDPRMAQLLGGGMCYVQKPGALTTGARAIASIRSS